MKAVIIGSAEIKDLGLLRENIDGNTTLICCDGGLDYAFKEGFMPDYILGDFDSVSPHLIHVMRAKGVKMKEFPPEKDFTDMELCIEFALQLGAEEIVILGGIGSRFDHTLANANILKRAADKGAAARLVNENNTVMLIKDKIKLKGKKGDIVSLLPFTEKVCSVTTKGLKYPLENADMYFGVSLGVSNEFEEEEAEIDIKSGYLFVILSKD